MVVWYIDSVGWVVVVRRVARADIATKEVQSLARSEAEGEGVSS